MARPLALALLAALTACVDPPPPLASPPDLARPRVIVPIDADGPVALVTRWPVGATLHRVGRLDAALRFETGEEPGLVGTTLTRRLRQHVATTLLTEAPRRVRRQTPIGVEAVVERPSGAPDPTDDELAAAARPLPEHRTTRELLESPDGLRVVDVTDDARPTRAMSQPLVEPMVERLVPDIVSLRELLSEEARVGDTWPLGADALLAILGRTAAGRRVEPAGDAGAVGTARLARLLDVDGTRVAELALAFDARLLDEATRGGISYRQARRITLQGEYWHDLDASRPYRLRLEGQLELQHTPTRIEHVPLGAERLARPFSARGPLTIALAFR